jgi:tripartite motif-containing protein 71
VQSTDYVSNTSSSASISSPIVLGGGTITVGGATACLTFTPPSLTGVLLNPVSIYVVDYTLSRVQQFSASGSYITQFGSNGGGNGQLNAAQGAAIDSGGNFWLADEANTRIEEFNSSGTYLNKIGTPGIANGQFSAVADLAFDSGGNIWVTDYENNRVQKLTSAGSWILTIPSSGCTGTGWPVCAASSSNGRFSGPVGIAIDSSNNAWVTDHSNNRVQKFNSSGTYLLGVGAGYQGVSGSIGASGSGNGQFNQGDGIAIDAGGDVWVMDNGNARVQEFNSSGTYLNQFADSGGGGDYIAIDPSGNVWVSNWSTTNVGEYSSCGGYIGTFGSYGSGNGQFEGPTGIAITGTPGGGGACITSVTPPANAAYSTGQTLSFTVTYTTAVTVTGTPRLDLTIGSNTEYANYVSGSGTTTLTFTYTIQSTDTASSGISVSGTVDLNGGTITNGGLTASQTFTPPSMSGITVNSTAYMLVADYGNNRVQKLDLDGNYINQFPCASGACTAGSGNGSVSFPRYAIVDSSNNIWVADSGNSRLEEFNSSGTYESQFGSSGSGNGNFSSTSNTSPDGIAIDGGGNFWAVDRGNYRVEKFNSSGTYLSQIGTTGTSGCGASQFTLPQYIHIDSSGNIDLADANCAQIEQFNSSASYIKAFDPTIASYGTFTGGGALDDFAFDACGDIWIQDSGANNLVEIDYQGNFITSTSQSGGVPGNRVVAGDRIVQFKGEQLFEGSADGKPATGRCGTAFPLGSFPYRGPPRQRP